MAVLEALLIVGGVAPCCGCRKENELTEEELEEFVRQKYESRPQVRPVVGNWVREYARVQGKVV